MFKTAKGISIPFPEMMREEYQVHPFSVRLNLSFEKIESMLLDFIMELKEPLFLVLEMPLNLSEEEQLRKESTDPFHKKTCYLDGQSKQQIIDIIEQFGNILLNDGISAFAVASHAVKEELYIQKYKVIDIFCDPPRKYVPLLEKYNLTETSQLTTVWDTFSQDHPGESRCIKIDGKDIYDVYQSLVERGMYVAKPVNK